MKLVDIEVEIPNYYKPELEELQKLFGDDVGAKVFLAGYGVRGHEVKKCWNCGKHYICSVHDSGTVILVQRGGKVTREQVPLCDDCRVSLLSARSDTDKAFYDGMKAKSDDGDYTEEDCGNEAFEYDYGDDE